MAASASRFCPVEFPPPEGTEVTLEDIYAFEVDPEGLTVLRSAGIIIPSMKVGSLLSDPEEWKAEGFKSQPDIISLTRRYCKRIKEKVASGKVTFALIDTLSILSQMIHAQVVEDCHVEDVRSKFEPWDRLGNHLINLCYQLITSGAVVLVCGHPRVFDMDDISNSVAGKSAKAKSTSSAVAGNAEVRLDIAGNKGAKFWTRSYSLLGHITKTVGMKGEKRKFIIKDPQGKLETKSRFDYILEDEQPCNLRNIYGKITGCSDKKPSVKKKGKVK